MMDSAESAEMGFLAGRRNNSSSSFATLRGAAEVDEKSGVERRIPRWAVVDENSPVETAKTSYLILLTLGLFGLQNVWSLLLANGTVCLTSRAFSNANRYSSRTSHRWDFPNGSLP